MSTVSKPRVSREKMLRPVLDSVVKTSSALSTRLTSSSSRTSRKRNREPAGSKIQGNKIHYMVLGRQTRGM